jgi:PAS domain S-box-containing protein
VIKLRDSLSRKLTVMNMLVSGATLVLASIAFFGYDVITFHTGLINNSATQTQMISSNAVSPLIFNDQPSAEHTLSAMRAAKHIVYAGIYTAQGQFFAGYWRDLPVQQYPLPPFKLEQNERYWFSAGQFSRLQTIVFQGKPVGVVYLISDLGSIYDRLKSFTVILFSILTASLVAALALSRVSQRVISQPILRLAGAARTVSQDKDYSVRVPASKDQDEVAILVGAFNEMLGEIQKRDSALQESERQFRALADSMPQLAWMAEPYGDLVWFNRRWFEFTGTTPDQMAGGGWRSVHDPQVLPDVIMKWQASIATGQAFQMVFPLRRADGDYRQFLTIAMPVRNAAGRVVRWFGTNTDITEQRRSEEALRQSEKLAATGRLAASIAHEINNPLEAVTNLVYLAQKQPVNAQKYLKLADQELGRIAQITKNTLGFYRDSASLTEVDIPQILEEVLVLYARKLNFKSIKLIPQYEAGAKILGYAGEVRQIFANLIANAIEALPENGSLTIRASKGFAADGTSRAGVRVTFLDNGTGIPAALRKKIFEPFYTTKKDVGTGLGLWLTSGLVEKHGGSIHLRSSVKPDKTWTAFSVFLPDRATKH